MSRTLRSILGALLLGAGVASLTGALAATLDDHSCCPGERVTAEASPSCQWVLPLSCCDEAGVPNVLGPDDPPPAAVSLVVLPEPAPRVRAPIRALPRLARHPVPDTVVLRL